MPSVLGDFPLKRMKSLRRSLTKTSLRIFHVAILENGGLVFDSRYIGGRYAYKASQD